VKSFYISIGGRVHGVGFRYFVLQKAHEFHVLGWVKNTPDGKVEIEVEGNSSNLESFIGWIKIGPSRAIINSISVTEITPLRNFTNFSIR